jgi:hydrogenase-4 component B
LKKFFCYKECRDLGASGALLIQANSLGIFLFGALLTLLLSKQNVVSQWVGTACAAAGSAGLMVGSSLGLLTEGESLTLFHGAFSFTNIEVRMNAYSDMFSFLIGAVGFAASIYSIGYVKEYEGRKSISLLNAGMQIFLMTMASVILAGNVFTFLIAWECMSIISYLLVVYEHEDRENQQAGFIYVVMTHVGTIFLFLAFFILQTYSGSSEFHQMASATIPVNIKSWVFLCALIGFGTKAGLVPLHIWLPRAHPCAPSHISALMSGVMIKTAVYGFLMIVFQFLKIGPIWWGIAAISLGGITAFWGVLYALNQVDQKKMLAYSSIENIGLLFMGIGAALILTSLQQPIFASFALIAVLYHLINHALFKSLLFMGAGAVISVTHTKNMDFLGGLIKRMPWTAFFVLIGSLAIAAMPPMNGFIGEWLLFQALFVLSFTGNSIGMHLMGILAISVLVITGALVALLFVRSFSMTFLAKCRSRIDAIHEVPISMRIAMGVLSSVCLVLGIAPFTIFRVIRTTISDLGFTAPSPSLIIPLHLSSGSNQVSIITIILILLCGLVFAWLLTRLLGGKTKWIRGETWACGNVLTSKMTYTASGYSKPIRVVFQFFLKPSRRLIVERDSKSPYFIKGYTYMSHIPLVVEESFYKPMMRLLVMGARIFRKLQNGQVQSYLAYLFATLVIVLIFAMRG